MNRKEYKLLVEGWNNYVKTGNYKSESDLLNEGILDLPKEVIQRFGDLSKGLKNNKLKDSFEVVIESLAPDLTKRIREAQIDLHVQDWRKGFEARESEYDFGSGGYPRREFGYDESMSEDWNAGYQYREETGRGEWTPEIEKMVVEKGIQEWNDLVEINVVSTSIKDFLNMLNPIELGKHMWHAIKKHGLQVALPVVIAEVVMHTLPLWGAKLLGVKASLIISQIPITEMLTPAYLNWVAGQSGEGHEEEPGYLDRYEEKYGNVPL